MGRRKYDPDQVREQVRLYLMGGGKAVWTRCAQHLGMAASTLKEIMGFTWPSGAQTTQAVEDERVIRIAAALREGPKSRTELANLLDLGPATVDGLVAGMIESGLYDIEQREQKLVLPELPPGPDKLPLIWPDGDLVKTAHASDLHFGSIYHQHTALLHFATYVADEGCEYILVSGDITAGQHENRDRMELYAYGADEQIDAACNGLPMVEGLTWLLFGGNHDYTHYKQGGTNVIKRICDLRPDCLYAGFVKHDVPLTGNLKIRLWHPRGGKPYAKSYRGQKGAEVAAYDWLQDAVSEEEMAAIVMLQWGHVHYKDLFWYGPMMVLNPGCFEAEYPWEAAGGLSPEIGGVIKTSRVSSFGWGSVDELKWLSYRPTTDDYRPVMHHNLMERVEIEPLFTLHA